MASDSAGIPSDKLCISLLLLLFTFLLPFYSFLFLFIPFHSFFVFLFDYNYVYTKRKRDLSPPSLPRPLRSSQILRWRNLVLSLFTSLLSKQNNINDKTYTKSSNKFKIYIYIYIKRINKKYRFGYNRFSKAQQIIHSHQSIIHWGSLRYHFFFISFLVLLSSFFVLFLSLAH